MSSSSSSSRAKPKLLLLLTLLLLCLGLSCAQRPAVPSRRLVAPGAVLSESFETFDDDADADADDDDDYDDELNAAAGDMQRTGEQLRQLLGQQLSRAVVPLATAPLATLNRRRPALVAPSSPAAAAARFADYDDAPVAAPAPLDYNPYRDNFSDMNPDGSYIFGYSLPNGVRRWERGYFSGQQQSRVVEGFSVEPRHYQSGVSYELRCYRADAYGYHPLGIEYIQQPPVVRRDLLPRVHCLNLQR